MDIGVIFECNVNESIINTELGKMQKTIQQKYFYQGHRTPSNSKTAGTAVMSPYTEVARGHYPEWQKHSASVGCSHMEKQTQLKWWKAVVQWLLK